MPSQEPTRKPKHPRARVSKSRGHAPVQQRSALPWALAIGAIGLGGYWLGTRGASSDAPQPTAPATAAAEHPVAPPSHTQPTVEGWDSSWDPLPGRPPPGPQGEAIVAAYTFAAKNPEIVSHIPCFCGCGQRGHKSVESCFVSERLPGGKPRWNPMGFG
jgi:hypothetical protein